MTTPPFAIDQIAPGYTQATITVDDPNGVAEWRLKVSFDNTCQRIIDGVLEFSAGPFSAFEEAEANPPGEVGRALIALRTQAIHHLETMLIA